LCLSRLRAQAQAEAAAARPVAAAGLLRSMRPALGAVAFWRGQHGAAVPAFLRALALIIPAQPLLHTQARPPPPCSCVPRRGRAADGAATSTWPWRCQLT